MPRKKKVPEGSYLINGSIYTLRDIQINAFAGGRSAFEAFTPGNWGKQDIDPSRTHPTDAAYMEAYQCGVSSRPLSDTLIKLNDKVKELQRYVFNNPTKQTTELIEKVLLHVHALLNVLEETE